MIYDDYISYCNEYKHYGKVLVLMEVGSFFEFYAVENETVKEGADMSEICHILNIQSTRKNKSIPTCSRSNPLMAGFPSYSLPKFIDLLLAEQYTIVLVEQTTPPPNPIRKVTQIISPSTYMDTTMSSSSSYLMCVYNIALKNSYVMSVSYVDLTTGELFMFDEEFTGDKMELVQEITRLVTLYSPRELVFIGDVALKNYIDRTQIDLSLYKKPSYQNAILKKVYPQTGLLSPIEYIDLERRSDAITCLVYLIQFAYEHNENIIAYLRRPTFLPKTQHLQLAHSSAEQLYLLPTQKQSSLIQLLNTCDTSIGKRYFRDCLIHPLRDPIEIEKRYEYTDLVSSHTEARTYLKEIKDIERIFRRILLRLAKPAECIHLVSSLKAVQKLLDLSRTHSLFEHYENPVLHHCLELWQVDKMDTIHFYKKGVHPEIDILAEKIESIHTLFQKNVSDANRVIGDTFFKLEVTAERQDYQILITKKRYENYCERVKSQFTSQPLSAANKTTLKLSFPKMDSFQQELHQLTNELKTVVNETYMSDLSSFHVFSDQMKDIVSFISKFDFHVTCAKNAKLYNYCRPIVTPGSSKINGKQLRHPLIEVFQKDIPYVGNDIQLEESGMLLYGINAAGKSSYMKSVGLAIIMAQAGMYVPADSFHFSPYDRIFTRIPSGDNLFKGQSTFVTEMLELRCILKNSTSHSLVIGDEVASGTESVSAISIVAAGIKQLMDKKTSFLFATHLHEIAQLDLIKSKLRIAHMSVHYDETNDVLVYDRVLKEGSGDTLYGLEVCKSLDMPLDFLELAHTIRKDQLNISPHVVDMKKSRYSSDVFVDICSICKNKADEIHHIQHQAKANSNGFIGSIHKNDTHNLIAVCKVCHDKIHNGSIQVNGMKQTNYGKLLDTKK